MKVKTLLIILFVVSIISGIFTYRFISDQPDTDIENENRNFDETIKVIYVRQHLTDNKLLLLVYETYDPDCGCFNETTITVNPLEYKTKIKHLDYPKTIRIGGYLVDGVYFVSQMED